MLASLTVASALVALVSAQSSVSSIAASSTVSQSMPPAATQGFDVNGVSSSDRFDWCHAQLNTCPQICGGQTSSNQCDQTALTYQCVCLNGTAPDVTAYTFTLPYYICEQTYIQCINAHPNDAQGQQTCKDNEKCGTLNATEAKSASSSSSSSSSASSTMASSAAASGSSATTGASASARATASSAALTLTGRITTGAFVAVLTIAFKLLL